MSEKETAVKVGDIRKVVKTDYISEEGFSFTFQPVEDTLTMIRTAEGYEARYLVQDDDPAGSPDEDDDDSIFLVHYHRSFDVRNDKTITCDNLRRWYQGEKIAQEKEYWIFPVSAYIHSGVRLKLGNMRDASGGFDGAGWDTSHVGAVLASKKEWRTRKAAEKSALQKIETWNQYLAGDIWGCVIERYDKGKNVIGDYDAVWGYYGYKYALESLKTFAG
jgi:hypothetical protein